MFESPGGIGDDAAVLKGGQVISTDAVVEGVHFIRGEAEWGDVAYKLFASNASDMAAMGAKPEAYTLALSIPKYWTETDFRAFTAGIRDFLADYPAVLAGGDTVSSREFFASVTVVGSVSSKMWLRSGASAGDYIYCTGTLGDSRLYLNKILNQTVLPVKDEEYFKMRHYRPSPRTALVDSLNRYNISAAMDISDGLIEDIQKLCAASDVSFCIDAERIPLSREQIGEGNINEHKLFYQKEALIGGEDYEILFTSPDIIDFSPVPITRIGRVISPKDGSFVMYNGKRHLPDEFKGYEHK